MSQDLITLEIDGPVAIISNNRPDKLNAARPTTTNMLIAVRVIAVLHEKRWPKRTCGNPQNAIMEADRIGPRNEDGQPPGGRR